MYIGFGAICGLEHPLGVLECAPVGRGPTVFGLVLLTLWDISPMGAVRVAPTLLSGQGAAMGKLWRG